LQSFTDADGKPKCNCHSNGNSHSDGYSYGYCNTNCDCTAAGYTHAEATSDTAAPAVRLVDRRSVIVSCFGNSRANLASSPFYPGAIRD
jgi:hypothetical protein